jgi:hypothetical protein
MRPVSLDFMQQLSVLACASGLALAGIWFGGLWLGVDTPDWLPPTIAGIAGFELFTSVRELAQRRRGDGNG